MTRSGLGKLRITQSKMLPVGGSSRNLKISPIGTRVPYESSFEEKLKDRSQKTEGRNRPLITASLRSVCSTGAAGTRVASPSGGCAAYPLLAGDFDQGGRELRPFASAALAYRREEERLCGSDNLAPVAYTIRARRDPPAASVAPSAAQVSSLDAQRREQTSPVSIPGYPKSRFHCALKHLLASNQSAISLK
jgi:hypothetical protein